MFAKVKRVLELKLEKGIIFLTHIDTNVVYLILRVMLVKIDHGAFEP